MVIPENAKIDFDPVKSNGVQLTQNSTLDYSFNIDYLNLNFEGVPNFDNSDFVFEPHEFGTKIFNDKMSVFYNDNLFGVMVFNPKSEIIGKHLIQLKLENPLFYTRKPVQILNTLNEFMNSLNLVFKGVNRLDLALDITNQKLDVRELSYGLHSELIKIAGRPKTINFYTSTVNGLIGLDGLSIGKRSSSKYFRIYDKSKELLINPKPYINSYWNSLGIPPNAEMWRYEYQLNSRFFREAKIDINLNDLFDKSVLFKLYQRANRNFFDVRYNTGLSQTNKEESFPFLDLDSIAKILLMHEVHTDITFVERHVLPSNVGNKRMVKGMLRSYYLYGRSIEFILPIPRILDACDLWSWFKDKLPYYLKEFSKFSQIGKHEIIEINDLIKTYI